MTMCGVARTTLPPPQESDHAATTDARPPARTQAARHGGRTRRTVPGAGRTLPQLRGSFRTARGARTHRARGPAPHAPAATGEAASARHARRHRLPSDRKSTRLNSSHVKISYAVFCLKKKTINKNDK